MHQILTDFLVCIEVMQMKHIHAQAIIEVEFTVGKRKSEYVINELVNMLNRPGVARAVLQTPLSLIN